MEVFLDCLPCVLRQVLEAARLATDRPEVHEEIMQKATKLISGYRKFPDSPTFCGEMHQIIKDITGVSDPYREVKKKNIHDALQVYPFLRQFLDAQAEQLYWALKIAAIGNIIDAAINNIQDLRHEVEKELNKEFAVCDRSQFEQELERAENLLVIGDNAGETVFDRLLMEQLSNLKITYAVRGEPIINDAVMADVRASEFDDDIKVVSTGNKTPGLILEECTDEFRTLFYQADLVISKGQGNYEGLADEKERSIYFLLKAKCPVLAVELGVEVNDYVFKGNRR